MKISTSLGGVCSQTTIGSAGAPKTANTLRSAFAEQGIHIRAYALEQEAARQIADLLMLDVKTIETYRARIKEKMGFKDAPELLQRAIAWVHGGNG